MGSLPLIVLLLTGAPDQPPPQDPPGNAITAPVDTSSTPTTPPGTPPTGMERLDWTLKSTLGPASLLTGILSASWGMGFDHPKEYPINFVGFWQRYGLRMSGVAVSNATEASLGLIWREDPRYHRDPQDGSYGKRFVRTVKMTFLSDRHGVLVPAYARFIAIAGTNVLSDGWRPNSDRGPVNTIDRVAFGFGGRLLGNMWDEFWPDVKQHVPFFNKH